MKKIIKFQHIIACLFFTCLIVFTVGCKKDENPEYSLKINILPVGSGTVDLSPNSGTYPEGIEVTLSPNPSSNYKFTAWSGTDASYVHNNKIIMSKNMDVIADFSLNSYSIAASVNPVNSGTITGAGTYDYGQAVLLRATPADGYTFTNWTENGTQVSTDATYSFTANGDRTLVANFDMKTMIRLQSGSGLNTGAHIYFVALSKNTNYFDFTSDEMFDYRKTDADWYIDGDVIPFVTNYKEFGLTTGKYYFLVSASGTVMVTTITVFSGKQTFKIYGTGFVLGVDVMQNTKSVLLFEEKSKRIINYKRE
ncbi:MAG: InlB B-repeat-containing protein [Bacteroidales bacterium]|nr:InlB B-repeat-containing protein [Bacteroidales bacterium]